MRTILITSILAAVIPTSAPTACRSAQLSDIIEDVHVNAASPVSALVQFGQQKGICLGIELTNLDVLNAPVSLELERGTVESVVRSILPQQHQYNVLLSDSVVLVRSLPPPKAQSQMDVIVPEYKVTGLTVPEASLALFWRLKRNFDPSVQGFAGHISIRHPDDKVLPIDEQGRTAREILTKIVSRSRGGAWIAGPCPVTDLRESGKTCWLILEYRDDSEDVANAVKDFVIDQKRRLEKPDNAPEKP